MQGWVDRKKNGLLISKKKGSYFFTVEMMIDIDLKPDSPTSDHCGSCTKCIDACPTNAIVKPYVVDGSKCISYFTIELKGAIPEPYAGKLDNWILGAMCVSTFLGIGMPRSIMSLSLSLPKI